MAVIIGPIDPRADDKASKLFEHNTLSVMPAKAGIQYPMAFDHVTLPIPLRFLEVHTVYWIPDSRWRGFRNDTER